MKAIELYKMAELYREKRDYSERVGDWAAAERYQRLSDETEAEADEAAAQEAREKRNHSHDNV